MRTRLVWTSVGAVGLLGAIGGAWMLSLPNTATDSAPPPIDEREKEAFLAAVKPRRRRRPLIVVVGINDATETVDYLMAYGLLRRADVADVTLLATGDGPVKLYPVFTVEPHATIAQFDAQHPDGADYVIVPAMSRDDDPAALAWIAAQAAKGAVVIGVCAGAKVVAQAGLLDGRHGTTHWYYVDQLRKRHPRVQYVPDRRFVIDDRVLTTTGITASIPMALTLIEAIAGRDTAGRVAESVGVARWDARHDSHAFQFTRPFALTAIGNTLAGWRRERFGIELEPGVDEVALALVADAWSRTYRSRALTWSRTKGVKETRNGVRIVPDRVAAAWPRDRRLPPIAERKPIRALNDALSAIAARYGVRTSDFVAMQLEYPARWAEQREVAA